VLRLGKIIGSSSEDDSYCEDSHSSFREKDDGPLLGLGVSLATTVSVLALPFESMVKTTSVRGFSTGDSGIEVRLSRRRSFRGEDRPVRGRIRS
jgi:hypothetical protein